MTATIKVDRIPAAGEQIVSMEMVMTPGGKGSNQAIAASRLGGNVELYCKMGKDYFREELLGMLESERVSLKELSNSKLHTGTGVIMVEPSGRNTIISVRGSNNDIKESDVKKIKLHRGDIAVSQLSVPSAAVFEFLSMAKKAGCTTILNCAPRVWCNAALLHLADYLIFNENELMYCSGRKV